MIKPLNEVIMKAYEKNYIINIEGGRENNKTNYEVYESLNKRFKFDIVKPFLRLFMKVDFTKLNDKKLTNLAVKAYNIEVNKKRKGKDTGKLEDGIKGYVITNKNKGEK